MSSRNRKISLVLAVIMILSLILTTVLTASVYAAETDPKKIDKFIVDFRNEEAQKKNSEIYIHKPTAAEPDPNTGGLYSFSADMQAMKIEYAASKVQKPFRIMTKMKGVSAEYKYWVVVYAADTNKPYSIYLHNSPAKGQKVDVVTNGKDTDGKFVVSEPFDLSPVVNGASLIDRWASGTTVNTLNFVTEDKEAGFYVKEFGFFKTAEDAKAYYAAVDLSKPSSEYGGSVAVVTVPTPAAPATPAAPTVSAWDGKNTFEQKFTVAAEDKPAADDTPTVGNLPEPVIMSFDGGLNFAKNAKFTDHAEETEGKYEFATLPDGTKALKLIYSQYGNWKPYRTMPAFKSANIVTSAHKYVRITYMTTDVMANTIVLSNNATGQNIVLVDNTAGSQGELVRSNAVKIDENGILERYVKGAHCTLLYSSGSSDSEIYIKELAFFATEDQAYEYYGDSEVAGASLYSMMNFAKGGTGGVATGANYGQYSFNDLDGTLDITYAESTNHKYAKYMAKIKFNKAADIDGTHKYVRLVYAAKQPDTVTKAGIFMYNDANGETVRLVENLVDTNGQYVLGETVLLHDLMMNRFSATGQYTQTMHNSLITNVTDPNCTYKIKALYFFPTRAAAEAFELPSSEHTVTVNGNDLSKYQIVIDEEAPTKINESAVLLANRLADLTGIKVPIVKDTSPETAYEILVGPSARAQSTARLEEFASMTDGELRMWAYPDGNDVIIGAVLPYNAKVATETYMKAFLFTGLSNIPDNIELGSSHTFNLTESSISKSNFWKLYDNVQNPVTFHEDFDNDEGYFNEENGADKWKYASGVMKADTTGYALSYIHVYEPDVIYKAKLMYTAENDGEMGLMLRYNSDYAWVKAGYDFERGEWYLKSREGLDFFETVHKTVPMTLTPDTWYDIGFTLDGPNAVLTVNGITMISVSSVSQLTPGRIAVYAENASVSVDDVDLVLLSGEGTIWKNVAHTKLPDEVYREGGTVIEMSDGSLNYIHNSNLTYKSLDNGKTWQKLDKWLDSSHGYPNIIRLNNGDLLQIISKTVSGVNYRASRTSSDDGATWIDGGIICYGKYGNNTTAGAGNMNDKLMQSAETSHWPNRIFYGQNYEGGPVEGRSVFCEFYYSDDNGKTWIKSETDSWEIAGNETEQWFGEAKMLECSDGTIRMYNSWNRYGCVVYTESADGGKTFGPLMKIPELVCAQSSMQFVRDVYADNDYTYYMVWVNSEQESVSNSGMTRARLTLAKTEDGKNWTVLGDVWRWESGYKKGGAYINHVVDPFINVTKDYILVGSGFSEHTGLDGESATSNWHQAQRQHIYSIPKASLPEGKALNKFTDVPYGTEQYEAVTFVSDLELFQGTGENSFSPNTAMNRAMFVTVLGRLAEADTAKYKTSTFKDVAAGQWYTSYVEWAAANGVVNGIGAGEYGPFNEVTVQQACVILARYANYAVATKPIVDGTLDVPRSVADFTDSASVASWAAKEVEWAVANGIYTGSAGKLNPTAPATRGLVATMFMNYVNAFGK